MIQIIKMEEKESIEKSFLSFASGLAIQTGEHRNWKTKKRDGPTGQSKGQSLFRIVHVISLNHTKYNLNPVAHIHFSGLHPKNTTSHRIPAKSSSFTRFLNSSYHPDPPRLNRSLHSKLNIKHGIHRRKLWGRYIQLLSHLCQSWR